MEFPEALIAIANRVNFPNESELIEVRAAITDFFAEPDEVANLNDEDDNVVKLNSDPNGENGPNTPVNQ